MQKTDTRKKAYALVKRVLYNIKEIERLVEEAREDTHGCHTGGSSGHAFVSDPTANAAIRAADELHAVRLSDGFVVYRPETWIRVIKKVYNDCPAFERDVMQTYFDGHGAEETGEMYYLSDKMVYYNRNEFLSFAVAAACQAGLVYVIDLQKRRVNA